ncbi:MAG: helicase-related protein [Cyanobacteriota/Melainabacteria group bacterium]
MWDFVLKEVETGRQVYIVFPLIDESESLSAKAATAEFEKLVKKFPKLKFGLMHGKLKPKEKDEVMEQFRDGEYHVLVSTTVIEVGVDVPNSTIMIIENADRFGLAQLHQLRGRVGRGGDQSYCFLVSDSKSQSTRERLEILTLTTDGFVVAEKDLEIRGPGEFMGFKQSGLPDLVLADLVQDAKILEDARNDCDCYRGRGPGAGELSWFEVDHPEGVYDRSRSDASASWEDGRFSVISGALLALGY